jgi:hypothetical protein
MFSVPLPRNFPGLPNRQIFEDNSYNVPTRVGTKGEPIQIWYVDWISRETLEKRLEKTPSNARCFAQGSSLMC